jgi:hypothetical protein
MHHAEGADHVIEGGICTRQSLGIALAEGNPRIKLSRPRHHGRGQIEALDHGTLGGERCCEVAWPAAHIEDLRVANWTKRRNHRRDDLIGDRRQVLIVASGARRPAGEFRLSERFGHASPPCMPPTNLSQRRAATATLAPRASFNRTARRWATGRRVAIIISPRLT